MKYLKKFNENLKVKTLVCKKDLYKSTYKSNALQKEIPTLFQMKMIKKFIL